MTNIDQSTYNELIAEARQLREHLVEWSEQISDQSEAAHTAVAVAAAGVVIGNLSKSRDCNDDQHHRRVEQALHNVETGQATRADAALLRRALA